MKSFRFVFILRNTEASNNENIGDGVCRLVRLEPYLSWALLGSALPESGLWNLFAVGSDSVRSNEFYFSTDSRAFLRHYLYVLIKNNKKCDEMKAIYCIVIVLSDIYYNVSTE